MSLDTADLPSDPDALRAFALACQAELRAAKATVRLTRLEIKKLKMHLARLRRMQFGQSSERLARQIEQFELQLEDLEGDDAQADAVAALPDDAFAPAVQEERTVPKRRPLPDHLPRQEVVHEPDAHTAVGCTCPACGAGMSRLGEDVTEVLDYVPGRFQVLRHVRPKYACQRCDHISQAAAPNLPIPRGRPSPAQLAHVLVAKYGDHLPLYRQSAIYARDGVDLDRSTLADWVG